jgi:hypothetical protein
MSLIAELARAKSEEDVKDAYIKALGLKQYTKGLIDIRTEEIWFESKDAPTPPVLMFAQLLFYVRDARKRGEPIPPFLAVIDREKAAIMETARALPILDDKSIQLAQVRLEGGQVGSRPRLRPTSKPISWSTGWQSMNRRSSPPSSRRSRKAA